MNTLLKKIIAFTLLTGALVACTSNEAGQARPDATTSSSPQSSPSTSQAGSTDQLLRLDTCETLENLAGQLPITAIKAFGEESCGGRYDGNVGFQFTKFPTMGLADYKTDPESEVSPTTIAGRTAQLTRKTVASSTGCAMSIEITESSRVDIVGSYYASLDETCAAVTALATAIAPNLPTG